MAVLTLKIPRFLERFPEIHSILIQPIKDEIYFKSLIALSRSLIKIKSL